jgi:hypothetical protein
MSNKYPTEIQNNLSERQLDLNKIFKLKESEQLIIIKMFDDLMNCFYSDVGMTLPGGMKMDYLKAEVLYTTLSESDYLVTRREKNLDSVLENN